MRSALLTILLLFVSSTSFSSPAKVVHIVDGDTFQIDTGDKVRMIGINAPEHTDIFGPEATQHLSELIMGKTVDLQPDTISKDRDMYGRLLRSTFVNGSDINKQMILDGFAIAFLKYRFDRQKENEYRQAQQTAQQNQNGMWGSGKGDNSNQPVTPPTPETKVPVEGNRVSSDLPKIMFVSIVVLILAGIGIYYYRKS